MLFHSQFLLVLLDYNNVVIDFSATGNGLCRWRPMFGFTLRQVGESRTVNLLSVYLNRQMTADWRPSPVMVKLLAT